METALMRARLLLTDRYLPARDGVKYAMPETDIIRENNNTTPLLQQAEQFLQILWNERCGGCHLHTRDDTTLQVDAPGTWNTAGGPDFLRATITLGNRRVRGDVEIHRREADWFAHGHHRDPAYQNVCLHVVALPSARPAHTIAGRVPPCLILSECVDETIRQSILATSEEYPYAAQVPPGRCALHWMDGNEEELRTWLEAAGLSRFREKTRRLLSSLEERGAEQGLYQHLFDALGYRANRRPFRELAQAVPLNQLRQTKSTLGCAALLFGTAGLLPDPSKSTVNAQDRQTLRHLWDRWWQCGAAPLQDEWKWSGVRPANRPDRRLAAGVSLLVNTKFSPGEHLLETARSSTDERELIRRLEDLLTIQPDESAPWLPAIAPSAGTARLLGQSRVQDIAANVALPYLAAEAARQDNSDLLRIAESAFLHMPKLQTNRSLKEIEHRLFLPPSRARSVVQRACHQQGLLAIHHDFCLALGADCLRCPLAAQIAPPST